MTARITLDIKKEFIQTLFNDIGNDSSSSNYFIGIGRSEVWNDSDIPPTPTNTLRDERNLRLGLQSVKLVTDYSLVVPRYNWSSGTTYSAFDDNVDGHPTSPYYVITDTNQVYICVKQSKNAAGIPQVSTVKPTGISTEAFNTGDGYAWKFLYSINSVDASAYLSANYMPIQYIESTDSSSPLSYVEHENIQNAASRGQINGFDVITQGSGYTSAPTVSIIGNGSGSTAVATINSGSVTKIELEDSASRPKMGAGWDYAEVKLSGGGATTEAKAVVKFAPNGGFGADARDDLRSSAIMFNVKPSGDEGGSFIVDNSFRQVGLFKNMLIPDSDGLYTSASGNALNKLVLSGSPGSAFSIGSIITGGTSNAKAIIDKVDSLDIYYHQTESTGFTSFQEGEAVTDADGGSGVLESAGADGDSDAYVKGDVDPFSGSLLYLSNNIKVERAADQTEDLKVIVQI